MVKPVHDLTASGPQGWDIGLTRIHAQVQPQVRARLSTLTRQLQALGLETEWQLLPTPRGLSNFLSVVGQSGLLFIVDVTLIDGMAVADKRGAALHIRLLDACGDLLSAGEAVEREMSYHASAEAVLAGARLARAMTTAYVMALGHVDARPRHASVR